MLNVQLLDLTRCLSMDYITDLFVGFNSWADQFTQPVILAGLGELSINQFVMGDGIHV
jgi:hypothetical protein